MKSINPKKVFTLKSSLEEAKNFFTKANLKVEYEVPDDGSLNSNRLYRELRDLRMIKSPEEIELMRYANKVSSEAHTKVMQSVKPGMNETEVEGIFIGECIKKGCKFQSYYPIVAGGDRGATLHYVANDKELEKDGFLLLDAGAEYHYYGADITRTFPVSGKFTKKQKEIYDIVLESQKAVINAMKPGVEWVDMHKLAEKIIAQGLLKVGILKGDLEEILKHSVAGVFFCHGLGHFLGLDTHDPPNRDGSFKPPSDQPGLKYIRCVPKLQPGMVSYYSFDN